MNDISLYEDVVKRTLIVHYTRSFLNDVPPDEFVDSLGRIFRLKKKIIHRISRYVQDEVEIKGHPIEAALDNVGFFAAVFKARINVNPNEQIFRRCPKY